MMADLSVMSLKRARSPPKVLISASLDLSSSKVFSSSVDTATVQASSSKSCMDGDWVERGDKGSILLAFPFMESGSYVSAMGSSGERDSGPVKFVGVKPKRERGV